MREKPGSAPRARAVLRTWREGREGGREGEVDERIDVEPVVLVLLSFNSDFSITFPPSLPPSLPPTPGTYLILDFLSLPLLCLLVLLLLRPAVLQRVQGVTDGHHIHALRQGNVGTAVCGEGWREGGKAGVKFRV
jgi:hypothetical protein